MFNQSCGCQGMNPESISNQSCGCSMNNTMDMGGCGMNDMQAMGGCTINGCPRPQPLVAPRRVCVSNQVTPVPQPVICPIECRRVNHCMYYPVFYPQYEQTFVNAPTNRSF